MRSRDFILATLLILVPVGAKAADLIVWWDEGYYAQEDEAVREIIAAFEQKTGKQVELTFPSLDEHPDKITAALAAGRPPDFAFGALLGNFVSEWVLDDRLVDLTDTVGAFSNLFDPDAIAWWTYENHRTRQTGLYAVSIGRTTIHLHVWKSLLEQAGFTLGDIPKEWDAFWSFWCDDVQPAVRRATGRDDIWGVGLSMSGDADTPGWCLTSSSSPTKRTG